MALREFFEDEILPRVVKIFGGDLEADFGRKESRRNSCPPRIVVYPVSGTITPTRNAGRNPTQMFTRDVLCVAELWAKDYDEAEQLMDNFAEAMQEAAVTSWRPDGEDWDEGTDAEEGVRVAMRFRLDVPLKRTARKTVTVNDWQKTGTIVENV